MLSIKEITNINAYQKIIVGLNKADLVNESERAQKIKGIEDIIEGRPYIFISAKTGENIENLIKMIYDSIFGSVTIEAVFQHIIKKQEIYNMFGNENMGILQFDQDSDRVVRVMCSNKVKEKMVGKLVKIGAEVKII